MSKKYPDLEQRVRTVLVRLGPEGNIDRCHAALHADGVHASRSTVGRAFMKVREAMQFEGDSALQPEMAASAAVQSCAAAVDRAILDVASRISAAATTLNVSTPQDIVILCKGVQDMIKARQEMQKVLDAIDDRKEKRQQQLADAISEEKKRRKTSIEQRKQVSVLSEAFRAILNDKEEM